MLSPKRRLELSDRARRDIRDILAYTLASWGERQLTNYRACIDAALHTIAQNPAAGRESIKSGLSVLSVERHRIYYRDVGGTVYVVRILHERMDASRHLDKKSL